MRTLQRKNRKYDQLRQAKGIVEVAKGEWIVLSVRELT